MRGSVLAAAVGPELTAHVPGAAEGAEHLRLPQPWCVQSPANLKLDQSEGGLWIQAVGIRQMGSPCWCAQRGL